MADKYIFLKEREELSFGVVLCVNINLHTRVCLEKHVLIQ